MKIFYRTKKNKYFEEDLQDYTDGKRLQFIANATVTGCQGKFPSKKFAFKKCQFKIVILVKV